MSAWRRELWHPHEKLWNWALIGRVRRRLGGSVAGQVLVTTIIALDSLLLAARVRARTARRSGGSLAGAGDAPAKPPVLYIDCGVHKHGEQIRWMHRWFSERYELHVLGFEAGAEHARDAESELADIDRLQLLQLALVGPEHEGDEVRFYKSGGEGKGDSLFGARGEEYDVVPARRLTQVLADEGYDLSKMPVILRMNIEGAERFVIEDLIAAGLERSIDGYYGMWDDLSKLDPSADERFRATLAGHDICNVTFNDRDLVTFDGRRLSWRPRDLFTRVRDLSFRIRRHAIRSDIEASLYAGLQRVARS